MELTPGDGHGDIVGVTCPDARTPAEERSEVASTFFAVMYVAISIPVLGVRPPVLGDGLRSVDEVS